FRCVGQALRRNDVQSALREQFRALLGIVAFEAHHYRHLDAHFGNGADDAFCDQVTAHDTAEDVHQHRLHCRVGQDDLEGFGNAFLGCTTTHVEEVGGKPAVQFDDVHGAHGQASAVDHAADVAIEGHVVEIPLCRVRLALVLLGGI